MTVPAYTTIYNAQTADTPPDGLTVTGNNPSVGWTNIAENPSTGEWYVFWNIVDYTNDTADPVDLTLTIEVQVDQTYHDATDVRAGDVFSNTAYLTWEDADSGGTTHNDSGAAPDVTVREPDLAMTKAVDNAHARGRGRRHLHHRGHQQRRLAGLRRRRERHRRRRPRLRRQGASPVRGRTRRATPSSPGTSRRDSAAASTRWRR